MPEKKPVKVRLAEKHARGYYDHAANLSVEQGQALLTAAYLAGFERAKALCLDFTVRYVEPRFTPMPGDDPAPPSKHMAQIGEQP